jgi:hypothetical protein
MTGLARLRAVALVVAAGAAVAGCGGAALHQEVTAAAPKESAPFTLALKPGQADTPSGTVLSMLHVVAEQALPAIPAYYDPRVRNVVGDGLLAEALATQRASLLGPAPTILHSDQSPAGTIVSVRLTKPAVGTVNHSFVLRRIGGRWLIAYDTILDGALPYFVQATVQNSIQPNATTPSVRAVRAATATQLRLHQLAVEAGSSAPKGSVEALVDQAVGPAATATPAPRATP